MFVNISPILEINQDLYTETMENLVPVSLEPVERDYLTSGPADYRHHFAMHGFSQVKPKTKPMLRPRRRSFLLARSNQNPNDDVLSH